MTSFSRSCGGYRFGASRELAEQTAEPVDDYAKVDDALGNAGRSELGVADFTVQHFKETVQVVMADAERKKDRPARISRVTLLPQELIEARKVAEIMPIPDAPQFSEREPLRFVAVEHPRHAGKTVMARSRGRM